MKIGVEGQKMPEALKRGPMWALERAKELGLSGVFFGGVLDMSPTLDPGFLRTLRARADELGLYIETSLGKINPYASAEAPELRTIGDGDIMLGFRRMIEAAAAINCKELLVLPANFKPIYRGRLACDRFRTDVTWTEQLAATQKVLEKLAPLARDLGVHLNIETHDEITSFEIVRMVEAVYADVSGRSPRRYAATCSSGASASGVRHQAPGALHQADPHQGRLCRACAWRIGFPVPSVRPRHHRFPRDPAHHSYGQSQHHAEPRERRLDGRSAPNGAPAPTVH